MILCTSKYDFVLTTLFYTRFMTIKMSCFWYRFFRFCFFFFCFVDLHVECVFRLFLFSIALPNTRRSVSRPEQVRQAGSVGDQEQNIGVTVLVAPRFHQRFYKTRAISFSTREYNI